MIWFRVTWKHLACGCLLMNVLLMLLILKVVEKEEPTYVQRAHLDDGNPSLSLTHLTHTITIVLLEFEEFENDLPETIKSLCTGFPGINFAIVSENVIYPPLNLSGVNGCKVEYIRTRPDPTKSWSGTRPECLIKTEFVFFIPDGTRLADDALLNAVKLRGVKHRRIHAFPIVSEINDNFFGCLDVRISLRNWSLNYVVKPDHNQCDALVGHFAFLMRLSTIKELNQIFSRPFDTSLYIQAKLRDVKIIADEDVKLLLKEDVFKSEHSKWKRNALQKQRLSNLYRSFGIKKVVERTGDVLWHGCTRQTARCFPTVVGDMPDFLYQGRWTPPCCLEHIRITARHVFKILEESKVRYWLEGGSLLGAARSGDIIPWDYDVDIGIYQEDVEKCELLKAARQGPVKDGDEFVWEKAVEGEFFRVQFSQHNRVHVDIFPFFPRNGIMTKNTWFKSHKQDMEFPEHYLKPLVRLNFVDWSAFAPNNYIEFLEMKFGKGCVTNFEYPVPSLLNFTHA